MKTESKIPIEIEPEGNCCLWWRPIAIVLGIMITGNAALILAGVRNAQRHEDRLLQAKWSLASDPDRSFDWIIVGDSSGTLGVDPTLLSKRLGERCVNLCTFGSMGIAGDLWSVEQYLKNHEPPRGVIVVHAANVWTGSPSDPFFQYAASIPESTPKLMARVLSLGARPSEIFVLLRYRSYFPIMTLKESLRQRLGWSTDDAGGFTTDLQTPPDGGFRLPVELANPSHVLEESDGYLSQMGEGDRLDWRHRLALDRLIELARQNDFSLFLANGPIASSVRHAAGFDDRFSGVRNELVALDRRHEHVICLSNQWFDFPPEQMENSNHVVGPAVDEYTNKLADEILSRLLPIRAF